MLNELSHENEKCDCLEQPLYVISVERKYLGHVEIEVKCLKCGKTKTILCETGQYMGLVYTETKEVPYIQKCNHSYEDVKEAYDLMVDQVKGRHAYGPFYISYLLRKSFF
ncbi:MAG: hypothetical protein RR922_03970 [Clostridia bacterium]